MKALKLSLFATLLVLAASCGPKYNLADNVGICRADDADLVEQAGYNYIEIGISAMLAPHQADSVWEKNYEILKAHPLPIRTANSFYPGDFKLVGPEADLERNLAYAETAMQRGKLLGIETFVLGSGRARKIPEGFSREEATAQFVELCKGIGDLGEKYGIVTVIEPLQSRETNFINSVREGTQIVLAVDKPYLKVLADFYHMARENEDAGAIIEAGEHLRHCHIAEKEERTCPGIAGDDFTPYFKALKKIGYKGRISLECRFPEKETDIAAGLAETRRQINLVW